MAVIATVGKVQGTVIAVDAKGVKRVLKQGDQIQEGETILTGAGATVVLVFLKGNAVTVDGNQTLVVDASVAGLPDGSTAGVGPLPKVVTTDPNQLIQDEATAAGLTGGAADGGSSFVQLLRLAELGGPGNVYAFNSPQFGGINATTQSALPDPDIDQSTPAQLLAVNDANTVGEGTNASPPVTGNVLGNDTVNPPETDLTVTGVRTGTEAAGAGVAGAVGAVLVGKYGTLTLNADGSYTYTLNNSAETASGAVVQALAPGETLTDEFTYTVTDGDVEDRAELIITIEGTEDLPIARANVNAIGEDAVAAVGGSVRDNDTPGDGTLDENVFALLDNPVGQYGTLVFNADGSYTYTLNNDEATDLVQTLGQGATDTETFRYTLTDKDGDVSESTLTITITGANDAPVANDDTNFVRLPGDQGDGGDGSGGGEGEGRVPRAIGNVLDDATYSAQGGTTFQDVADTDVDLGDTLRVTGFARAGSTAFSQPGSEISGTYGTLVLNADGSYTYTQRAGVPMSVPGGGTVEEVFNYVVSDDSGAPNATDTGTLTISLFGQNDRPEARDDFLSGTEDQQYTVTTTDLFAADGTGAENDFDVDQGDAFTSIRVFSTPEGGQLTLDGVAVTSGQDITVADIAAGKLKYTPPENSIGQRQMFTYTVSDGELSSGLATVNITLAPDNDPPVANPDTNFLTARQTAYGDGSDASDDDALDDRISGNVVTGQDHGQFMVNEQSFPFADQADTDDQAGITVTGVRGDSTAFSPVDESGPVTVNGQYGTLQINSDGTYTYDFRSKDMNDTLDDGERDFDTFEYKITDSDGGEATSTLTISIWGRDDQPTAFPDSNMVEWAYGGTDAPVDAQGNVLVTNSYFPNYKGGVGDVGDTDPDDEPLTVTRVSRDGTSAFITPDANGEAIQGLYGTLTMQSDGTYRYDYRPTGQGGGESGPDVFTYSISDGDGPDVQATLSIYVNQPPVAADDQNASFNEFFHRILPEEFAAEGTAGNVLTNSSHNLSGEEGTWFDMADSDPNGDPRTIVGVAAGTPSDAPMGNLDTAIQGQYGTLTISQDGTYNYDVSGENFAEEGAIDVFTYTVSDGALTDTGTLTINLRQDNTF